MAEILNAAAGPQAACDALVRRALDHGGSDNVTVVVADFREG
jgi:serine/threonine protein phosphatase PrpC